MLGPWTLITGVDIVSWLIDMVGSFAWFRLINDWYWPTGLNGFVEGSIWPEPPSIPGKNVRVLLGTKLSICFMLPKLSAAPTWNDAESVTFSGGSVGKCWMNTELR